MLILKFGGTSVGSAEAIKRLVSIVKDDEHRDKTRVVVVSAFSGITDRLIDIANKASSGDSSFSGGLKAIEDRHFETAGELLSGSRLTETRDALAALFLDLNRLMDGLIILRELSKRVLDHVMSYGEQLSAVIISAAFREQGAAAGYLDSRLLIRTDSNYGNARFIQEESYPLIRACLDSRPGLQIASGFIGMDAGGNTTTLGRGGSDLSAAIYGAAVDAEAVEIWTDVDGILTADPRQVKNAFLIDSISYVEAMELSHFGAKVLHPPTVRPLLEKDIPLHIRNTFNPGCAGTVISKAPEPGDYIIRGISSIRNIVLVRVQGSGMFGVAGFSSRLFGAMARRDISIILNTQSSSEYNISFAIPAARASDAASAVEEEFEREIASAAIEHPIIENDTVIIAVVGARMRSSAGVAGKVFHALGRNGINVVAIAQGSSELNISAVVRSQDEAKALNAVHEAFFLAGIRSVNLFLVGTGLIGGTLLAQLANNQEVLADKHRIRVNLAGAANSRNMLFNPDGLSPGEVKKALQEKGEAFELEGFIERMRSFNLPNTAFCDCTASDSTALSYSQILRSSIPVITPNKRANSGPYEYYRGITNYSRKRGIPYLYETTVCAGLPVISTLRDLYLSGDKVHRIEAVLSGTLSYIFNNYDGSKPFSALVREAKSKGYTEPDPRDDLNAMDAARKALVLARECGMMLEFSDVGIEPILPEACFKAPDVESFFGELEKHDGVFEKRRAEAAAEGKALRYVALIENGSARIALRAEQPGSPFLSLEDADNIVVITTDRYSRLPLIVKGPGAGAEVTAGGVFADIVRIARTLV